MTKSLGTLNTQRESLAAASQCPVWKTRQANMRREQKAMETTILIVDDDEQFSHLLTEYLKADGYRVLCVQDGVDAVRTVEDDNLDLIVLDVMMPRMDGWEACRRIRQISDVPIIMLSCRTSERDKVRGLELGADDYVAKPVTRTEFVARVRAALRRGAYSLISKPIVEVDGRLIIDRVHCEVHADGRDVSLSPTEYRLLKCLLDNAGRVLTYKTLLTQVWGPEHANKTDYLKVHVHNLRKKIEKDPENPRYIVTERGLGYRFHMTYPGKGPEGADTPDLHPANRP